MAKKLFHDMNVSYKVVELDLLEYGSQFQDALCTMTGDRTVSIPVLAPVPEGGSELGALARGHPGEQHVSQPFSEDLTWMKKWREFPGGSAG